MIGLGKSIAHTKASMLYGWNEEKYAKIVLRNYVYGDSPPEITKEFKMVQSQNITCRSNTLSFVLSPTIEDGKQLTSMKLNSIAQEFLKEMNLLDRQAIGFVHFDKNHKHIHLYVNRINFQGNAYKDNFIGKKSQKAAEKVAKKLNLKTVKEIQKEKLDNLKEIRKYIKINHEEYFISLESFDFDKYQFNMKKKGIIVKPIVNKSYKLQGFRYIFKEISLKGSDVHRSLSVNKLKKSNTIKNNRKL